MCVFCQRHVKWATHYFKMCSSLLKFIFIILYLKRGLLKSNKLCCGCHCQVSDADLLKEAPPLSLHEQDPALNLDQTIHHLLNSTSYFHHCEVCMQHFFCGILCCLLTLKSRLDFFAFDRQNYSRLFVLGFILREISEIYLMWIGLKSSETQI